MPEVPATAQPALSLVCGVSGALEPLRLTVYGDPVPWTGKQVNRNTGNRFIPARQAEATGRIIDAVERRPGPLEPFPVGEALMLAVDFVVKRPKGHYGTGRNAAQIKPAFIAARPTGRPDLSNLVKLIEDGIVLAGVVTDDDQVVSIAAEKRYTMSREERPRTELTVAPLND